MAAAQPRADASTRHGRGCVWRHRAGPPRGPEKLHTVCCYKIAPLLFIKAFQFLLTFDTTPPLVLALEETSSKHFIPVLIFQHPNWDGSVLMSVSPWLNWFLLHITGLHATHRKKKHLSEIFSLQMDYFQFALVCGCFRHFMKENKRA